MKYAKVNALILYVSNAIQFFFFNDNNNVINTVLCKLRDKMYLNLN